MAECSVDILFKYLWNVGPIAWLRTTPDCPMSEYYDLEQAATILHALFGGADTVR